MKTNGTVTPLRANGVVTPQRANGVVTPLRANGTIRRGDKNAEETLTTDRKRHARESSPDRTSADNGTISDVAKDIDDVEGEPIKAGEETRNSMGPKAPSSGPSNNPSRKYEGF